MEEINQQQQSGYNVLSILGFIFAFLFPPVGFILGIIALSQIKKTNEKGKGLAIAAIVFGAIFFLLLILIVFVGIAWIGIRNVVQNEDNLYGGEEQLDLNSMCLNTEAVATKVESLADNNFVVTLRKNSDTTIGGVKLVFTNEEGSSSYVQDVPGDIGFSIDNTIPVFVPSEVVSNPNKVDVAVYFLDASGNAQLCQSSNSFEF